MKCTKCGKEIPNDSLFCEFCGVQVKFSDALHKKSKRTLWIILSVVLAVVIAVVAFAIIQEQQERQAVIAWEQQQATQIEMTAEMPVEMSAEAPAAEAERERELARQREDEARRQELLNQGYVDLGLPSGTLWRNANEGGNDAHYNYDEAIRIYGHKLPTKQQIEELVNYCYFSFQWGEDVNVVTGPNGMSIKFPAACYEDSNGDCYGAPNGYYWSCTPCTQSSGEAYCFYFYDSPIYLGESLQFYKLSVRLVAD